MRCGSVATRQVTSRHAYVLCRRHSPRVTSRNVALTSCSIASFHFKKIIKSEQTYFRTAPKQFASVDSKNTKKNCGTWSISFQNRPRWLISQILFILNSMNYVRCLLIDYLRAFDTVYHSILFQELRITLDLPLKIYNWIADFFTGRSHCVK